MSDFHASTPQRTCSFLPNSYSSKSLWLCEPLFLCSSVKKVVCIVRLNSSCSGRVFYLVFVGRFFLLFVYCFVFGFFQLSAVKCAP